MQNKLCKKIKNNSVNPLLNYICSQEEKEYVEYGLKQFMTSFIGVMVTLLVGKILGVCSKLVLFLLCFIPLRSYVGGYHAKTRGNCVILSMGIVFGVGVGYRYSFWNSLWFMILGVLSGIFIWKSAPIGNEKKQLSTYEKRKFRTKIHNMLIWILGAYSLALYCRWDAFREAAVCAIVCSNILMVIQNVASGNRKSATSLERTLSFDEVISYIDNRHPFNVRIRWNNGNGHAVVCGGYSRAQSSMWIIDPWENTTSQPYNYTSLVEGTTLATGSGRYRFTVVY
ncbi:MAG: hypothetical protein EOM40_04120 [Clostridia bacterium]|nr:hypothetical protein [Clostridia bacterium]NCC44194.1 hypothetical protein [Clostridia bacterium]